MNASDIENMTVVALKKELKARNLSVTGNKSELVQRLSSSVGIQIQHLAQTVETSAQNETSTTTIAEEVSNIEQELNAALIGSSKLKDIGDEAKCVDVNDDVLKDAGETLITTESVVKKDTASAVTTTNAVTFDQETKEKPAAALTEEDRKVLRAKKFNIPLVQTKESRAIRFGIKTHTANTPSDEVKEKRAERFGLPSSATTSKSDTSSQDERLKQRALRFGTSSASTASKITLSSIKASSSTSTNVSTDSDQQDALVKRKRRFAESALSNTTKDASVEDKKLARAQRFGLKA